MIKSLKNLTLFEWILWFCSLSVIAGTFLATKAGDTLTVFSSLLGVTALIFIAKGDVLGQILTIIFSILYAVISYKYRYFSEILTYLGMTAPIAGATVVEWIKNPYSERQVRISTLSPKKAILLAVGAISVTVLFFFIMRALKTPNLYFSTVSITTSFLASGLMLLRSPYYAIAYALNDVVLVVLWVLATKTDSSFMPMVVCFLMFFVNDVYGFVNWKVMARKQQT